MTTEYLKRIQPAAMRQTRQTPVDAATLAQARQIVDEVREGGDAALRSCITRFEGRPGDTLMVSRDALEAAREQAGNATAEARRLADWNAEARGWAAAVSRRKGLLSPPNS